jgi:acyl-coenzyme A synthetase/AMP-(fatty) acid ligase
MSGAFPARLPILRDSTDAVARQGERFISRQEFLAEIMQLAERLPAPPYVVNFCSDRYRFTVAWVAAMLRGQVTLLPSSRDAHAVTELQADYQSFYVLTDNEKDNWPGPTFFYPSAIPAGEEGRIPAFPPDQVAAVLFTSGSTGRPSLSLRRWGRLVAGSLAAGEALRVDHYPEAAVVATVPHAHSYGLESAVMLPLQHGLLLTAERPFFAAAIQAALQRAQSPDILVTTPVHLRALVEEAAEPNSGSPSRVGFILSATAPLSQELAARAEAAFRAPVFEIYGCSEAGQLATRRTIDGPVWRSLNGFRLYKTTDGCWAAGPAEEDVRLADEIEPAQDNTFILRGRTADLVNIAGKRSSLAYLTQQLLAVEGVQDGVFLMPQEESPAGVTRPGVTRLAAVALAPGLSAPQILSELRNRIDPAFLSRPLYVVDTLPRNELGKLPRSEILRLIGQAPRDKAEKCLPPISVRFPADHPAGPGHFPGHPVLPGAALLDELAAALFPEGWSGTIEAAKFHHPVRPGDTIIVTQQTDCGSTRFECRLASSGQLVASGILRAPSLSR